MGLRIVTSSVTFIKSVNQSSIKLCQILPCYHAERFHEIASACVDQCNVAALLKEAFSGLAVEMNQGFSSLGALLKVKNNAKGDDNAPALSDLESDDRDSGSDKESEEPAKNG